MNSEQNASKQKSPKPKGNGDKDPVISKYQKFKPKTVHRSSLKNAPYNPRTIDRYARKRLREVLKRSGLVEGLVWNKRTGNIVGGHQRLREIDGLEDTEDYLLTVCEIDVDDAEERTLNIVLNNPNLQGNWDHAVLEEVIGELAEMGKDVTRTGFDRADLQMLFDEGMVDSLFDDQVEAEQGTVEGLDAIREAGNEADRERKEAITTTDHEATKDEESDPEADAAAQRELMIQRRGEYIEKSQDANASEIMVVIVFDGVAQRNRFMAGVGCDVAERYISGAELAERFNISIDG
jgi:hypothetical protein